MFLASLANRNKKGFTLVELMVVVVIIGVLVAIAIPIFQGVQERARVNSDLANARILNGATAMWMAETEDATQSAVTMVDLTGGTDPYLQEEPQDPWGAGRAYSTDTNGIWQPLGTTP